MSKLLLSVMIEVLAGVSVAGVILAVVIPALGRFGPAGQRDPTSTIVVVGVLAASVAVAIFRPGSAIRRYMKR
jgi:hypothetical protein